MSDLFPWQDMPVIWHSNDNAMRASVSVHQLVTQSESHLRSVLLADWEINHNLHILLLISAAGQASFVLPSIYCLSLLLLSLQPGQVLSPRSFLVSSIVSSYIISRITMCVFAQQLARKQRIREDTGFSRVTFCACGGLEFRKKSDETQKPQALCAGHFATCCTLHYTTFQRAPTRAPTNATSYLSIWHSVCKVCQNSNTNSYFCSTRCALLVLVLCSMPAPNCCHLVFVLALSKQTYNRVELEA